MPKALRRPNLSWADRRTLTGFHTKEERKTDAVNACFAVLFFGEQFSPFSSLWFPKISVVYSCSFKEYQYISEKSRTHSRRYRGWNPWFYGNVSIMVIKAWMSNYNCLTMMILRKCRANYEELTSLINRYFKRPCFPALWPDGQSTVWTGKGLSGESRDYDISGWKRL